MINAIGSSFSTGTSGPSAAGLEAQLTRYQKQLSDCVNCAETSKTPQGQETARSLSDKISQIKAQLDAVATSKTTANYPPVDIRNSQNADSGAQAATQTGSTTATLGNYLDLYA